MHCPLCESATTVLIKKIPIDKVKKAWLERYGIEVFSDIPKLPEIELYACSACGVGFYYPSHLASNSTIYENLSKTNLYYQTDKWEFSTAIKDIRGAEKLMEIGCGEGGFLKLAYENGVKEVRGIEICDSARECGRGQGFEVDNIVLEEAGKRYASYFDAVCAFQVLEHSPTPRLFIENALKMLKPNGKFIIGVPNAESYLKNLFVPLDMPPHHMTKWSTKTLEKLCQIFSLKLVRIEEEKLQHHQLTAFLESFFESLRERRVPPLLLGGYPRKAVWLIIRNGVVRRFLKGQTIYACYIKK